MSNKKNGQAGGQYVQEFKFQASEVSAELMTPARLRAMWRARCELD